MSNNEPPLPQKEWLIGSGAGLLVFAAARLFQFPLLLALILGLAASFATVYRVMKRSVAERAGNAELPPVIRLGKLNLRTSPGLSASTSDVPLGAMSSGERDPAPTAAPPRADDAFASTLEPAVAVGVEAAPAAVFGAAKEDTPDIFVPVPAEDTEARLEEDAPEPVPSGKNSAPWPAGAVMVVKESVPMGDSTGAPAHDSADGPAESRLPLI